ncbi:hypothetical protein BJY21_000297 [Kineosphaera limosa]|uniref:Uncharacterized protein n=1 Tax=Kineosphaera limosa NBRC 100340 TaxID=1184609 RepID=K6WWP7_9MICO|nr:hypothetical protein [Kineosphaera limosa]NYD99112.1 hypothetical protein [Kineosphaera limosa]GAB96527.1 hypothetical protein KILIM_040_00360 [Kineosphaera limosa NBRC 100340]
MIGHRHLQLAAISPDGDPVRRCPRRDHHVAAQRPGHQVVRRLRDRVRVGARGQRQAHCIDSALPTARDRGRLLGSQEERVLTLERPRGAGDSGHDKVLDESADLYRHPLPDARSRPLGQRSIEHYLARLRWRSALDDLERREGGAGPGVRELRDPLLLHKWRAVGPENLRRHAHLADGVRDPWDRLQLRDRRRREQARVAAGPGSDHRRCGVALDRRAGLLQRVAHEEEGCDQCGTDGHHDQHPGQRAALATHQRPAQADHRCRTRVVIVRATDSAVGLVAVWVIDPSSRKITSSA